jgi:uncharacterized membrane protein YccC
MPNANAIFGALSSAGIGTAIGYVSSAVIQARSQKKTRAEDASVLVAAASELTDRLLQRNSELAHANATARRALAKLIDAVQQAENVFERFPEVGDGATNRAMMALLQEALDVANQVEI